MLSSDRIGEELAGLPAEAGSRTPEWTRRVHEELLHRATVLMSRGESVVIDASFGAAWQRTAAVTAAATVSADLVQLRCTAPTDMAAADPWPDATVIDTAGDTAGPQADSVQRALRAIRPRGPHDARRPARPYMCPG